MTGNTYRGTVTSGGCLDMYPHCTYIKGMNEDDSAILIVVVLAVCLWVAWGAAVYVWELCCG